MNKFISTIAFATLATVSSFAMAADQTASKEVTLTVSEVYVPGGFSSQTDAVVIFSGMFPNSCYKWVRTDVTHTSQKVHEVRAIGSVSQAMCLMVMVPYQRDVNLGKLAPGEHILRIVNGDGTFFEKTVVVE